MDIDKIIAILKNDALDLDTVSNIDIIDTDKIKIDNITVTLYSESQANTMAEHYYTDAIYEKGFDARLLSEDTDTTIKDFINEDYVDTLLTNLIVSYNNNAFKLNLFLDGAKKLPLLNSIDNFINAAMEDYSNFLKILYPNKKDYYDFLNNNIDNIVDFNSLIESTELDLLLEKYLKADLVFYNNNYYYSVEYTN